jgi:hypothetical protein
MRIESRPERLDSEKEQINKQDSYTLIVVHCKGAMDWINDVPAYWHVIVYEKCGQTTNQSSTGDAMFVDQPIEIAGGAQECDGYLHYIIDNYGEDKLADVNIFIHDDALQPYSKWKGAAAHTMFHNFTHFANATLQLMTKDQGFLHYGVTYMTEKWGTDPYHGKAMQILWPFFATPKMPRPPEEVAFKPSAHMAVRKERILAIPVDVYKAIKQQLYYSQHIPGEGSIDARRICCAMERTWHILFGEPPILPSHSIVTDHLNLTKCDHPSCN